MRRFLCLLIFVLIVCLVQTVEARKLALLVGVDDYDNVPSLKCCVNDMKALNAALIKVGFKESDIIILTTGGAIRDIPTKGKIEQKVAEILSAAQAGDIVFFAFSGHGAREGRMDYFCPPFADPNNLDGTCVSITKVMDDLSKCQARFKWMVVDACHNTPNSRDAKAFQVIPAPPQGIALFQSCDKGEKSYEEDRDGGNGYFTKNLVTALSGEADTNHDGKLTLLEVCAWTTSQTQADVAKAENKIQRPYLNLSAADFTLSEDMNVPKAKKLVEEARKAVEDENYELAIKKYDEAIALCPRYSSIRRERNMAQKLLKRPPAGGGNPAPQRPAQAPTAAQTPTGSPKAGERKVEKVNGVEFAFRWCPSGTFIMGSPMSEEGRFSNETQHQVTLTKGFWMMETEVTQKQWKAVMGNLPDCGFKGDDLPVERVSWNDCQEFCKKCKKLGLSVQLPTEAQWEYACRSGTTGAYAGNLDEMAWYNEFSNKGSTHPVGTKKPNAWGLYDMHGNVWEWCADYWNKDYPNGIVTDPTGPSNGSYRVFRGGGWSIYAQLCRSARRSCDDPDCRGDYLGFRCVRSITRPEN